MGMGYDRSCSECDSDEVHEFSDRQEFECKDCGKTFEWVQVMHECDECGGDVKRVGPMVP